MEDRQEIFTHVFTEGSIVDANSLFQECIRSAFPTMRFRELQLTHLLPAQQFLKGKSANHIFTIRVGKNGTENYWEVRYHRFREGVTPDRVVILEYTTLEFVKYAE